MNQTRQDSFQERVWTLLKKLWLWVRDSIHVKIDGKIRDKYLDKPFHLFYTVVLIVSNAFLAIVSIIFLVSLLQCEVGCGQALVFEILIIVFLLCYLTMLIVLKWSQRIGFIIFQIVAVASPMYTIYSVYPAITSSPFLSPIFGTGFSFGISTFFTFILMKDKFFQWVIVTNIVIFSILFGGQAISWWATSINMLIIMLVFVWKGRILENVVKDIGGLLKEKEEDSKLLDILNEGIILISMDKKVLFANKSVQNEFKLTINKNDDISSCFLGMRSQLTNIVPRISSHLQTQQNHTEYLPESIKLDTTISSIEELVDAKLGSLKKEIETQDKTNGFNSSEPEVYESTFHQEIVEDPQQHQIQLDSNVPPKQSEENTNSNLTKRKRLMEIRLTSTMYCGKPALFILFGKVPEELTDLRSEYKDHLIASISHELQTPLNCVLGLIEETFREASIIDKMKTQYLKPIYCSTRLLSHLVRDLVDFSDLKRSNIFLEFNKVDLVQKFEEIKDLFAQQASIKGLNFDYIVDPTIPKHIYTDSNRLSNILINLISNGLKFTQKGHVIFRVTHDPYEAQHDTHLMFSVEDSGVGMTALEKQNLEKVLENPDEPHFVSRIRNSKGVCLGLTITQTILKRLGSPGLTFQTKKGAGSVFSFQLHQYSAQTKSPNQIPKEIEKPLLVDEINVFPHDEGNPSPLLRTTVTFKNLKVGDCHCKRVLVVDDNEFNILTLSRKLSNRGLTPIPAFTAREALRILKEAANDSKEYSPCSSESCPKIRLIFMDVDMPDMNGLDATREIIRMIDTGEIKRTPVIGCSAFDKQDDFQRGKDAGMSDYLAKPVTDNALDRTLREHLLIINPDTPP